MATVVKTFDNWFEAEALCRYLNAYGPNEACYLTQPALFGHYEVVEVTA